MAVQTELMTVANLAKALGVPQAKLARRIKEEHVTPDEVKRGCSYYSKARVEGMRSKLGV